MAVSKSRTRDLVVVVLVAAGTVVLVQKFGVLRKVTG